MPQLDGSVEICEQCPGFCCKVFFLSHTKKKYKEIAQKDRELLQETMKETDVAKMSDLHALKEVANMTHNAAFIAKNTIRIRGNKDRRTGESTDRAGPYPHCSNTCKQFDSELGRCKDWENRPHMCRSYICDPAKEGRVPTAADFPYTAQFTQKEAKAVMRRRKRAEKAALKGATTATSELLTKPVPAKKRRKRKTKTKG